VRRGTVGSGLGKGVPTMDSQTKHEFWIITVSTVAMVVTCAIAFAVFAQLLDF
jgi:hypothetical protein